MCPYFKQKILFFFLFVFPPLFLACNVEEKKDPNTLVFHIAGEPDTLNPITGQDAYESTINGFIFDTLIERDPATLEFVPKMAWRWEVSEDKLEYTFYLRKDVFWHDKTPFSADDILFTLDRIRDPKVNAPHLRNYYQDIKSLEKIDDHTVKFTYAKLYFRALEFVGGMPILPKHIYGSTQGFLKKIPSNSWIYPFISNKKYDFNKVAAGRHPIGTGPFRFVKWKSGRYVLLEANPNYWDKQHTPEIKKIRFKVVPNDTVSLQMLKKGDLDFSSLRPIQWVRQTNTKKFQEKFNRFEYYTPGYRYIGWNANRALFTDRRVRWALSHLVNQKEIVEKLEYGLGKMTTGPFWPLGYGYNQNLPPVSFSPQKAKKLLLEAGWKDHDGDGLLDKDGQSFKFTFLIPSGLRFYERLASIMKKDMSRVGIEVEIERMEWSVFLQRLNERKFDAVSLGWSGTFDPDPYQIWHSSMIKEGHNFVNFRHPDSDHLIEQVRVTFNKEERTQLLEEIHRIIYEEQPYTFLYSPASLKVVSKRFGNVKVYRGGLDIREWTIITP